MFIFKYSRRGFGGGFPSMHGFESRKKSVTYTNLEIYVITEDGFFADAPVPVARHLLNPVILPVGGPA